MNWKILKSETAFETDFFSITKDRCQKPDGKIVDAYYTIHRPDVVVVAALTAQKEIILIEQYRHPLKSTDIEVPAGYIEEYERDIVEAAKRELLEETGFQAENYQKMYTAYASAGLMDNKVHFFLATDARKIREPQLDPAEQIEVRLTSWNEALQLLADEKIKDLASIHSILLVKNYLDAGNLSG